MHTMKQDSCTDVYFICNVDSIMEYLDSRIIFFDGVCNLCNRSVQLVFRHDPKGKFLLAPLQSAKSKIFLKHVNRQNENIDSIVLYDRGKVLVKSSAVLQISRSMSGLYPLLAVFMIVPRVIRDRIYDWISRNRYHWFGKRDRCMVPSEKQMQRFIFLQESK